MKATTVPPPMGFNMSFVMFPTGLAVFGSGLKEAGGDPPRGPAVSLARDNRTQASWIGAVVVSVRRSVLPFMLTPALLVAVNVKVTDTGTLSPAGAPNVTELSVAVTLPWFAGRNLPGSGAGATNF